MCFMFLLTFEMYPGFSYIWNFDIIYLKNWFSVDQ